MIKLLATLPSISVRLPISQITTARETRCERMHVKCANEGEGGAHFESVKVDSSRKFGQCLISYQIIKTRMEVK